MPTLPVIQPSFAAGELSPFLYGRVDLAKYHVGARTLLNMFVHPHGGASNRPGTRYIGGVDDHTQRHRLIPFQFRASPAGQNYALLLGNLTMQVVMNGGFVLLPTKAITGATKANPGVLTVVGHGYTTGSLVAVTGVVGMTQLNGNSYTVTAIDADHVSIGVDTTGFSTYTSGGTAGGNVYTLATPYAAADLPILKFVQSADTMTLTHPSYAPRYLTRSGHAAWSLATVTFTPATAAPTGLASTAPGTTQSYQVTAVNDTTGEESLPSLAAGSSNETSTLTWTNVAGCSKYNVYKQKNALYGFIGQAGTGATGFTDTTVLPDTSNTPPQLSNPFASSGNWPGCSSYFLQRQVFANTTNQPQTLWFTDVGAFTNMNVSSPTKDSDAITRTLIGRQVNEVRHLVPMQSLLVMTSGAEWRCWPGPTSAALTPASCTTLPQSAFGCNHVPPIQTANSLLFVQERGSRVRELAFDVLQDQYESTDMSVLASHLFYDSTAQFTLQEWAFAEEPFRIVWSVRSDGTLLGFTFMKEHDVYAWHRHATDGAVESVCSIPEADGQGISDAVYLVVNRQIPGGGGGQTKRYVERLASRTFATVADAWFVDCGLEYNGDPTASVSGLDHLEGKTVAILGDGSVVPSQVVTGGTVALDGLYSKVIVGLPYTAQLESLDLEVQAGGGTGQGEMKKIARVTLRVKDARGLAVGLNQGALQEVKQRSSETLGTAMQPFTGDWQITVPSEWNRDGRLFVQQSYPLPATILALIPEVALGD